MSETMQIFCVIWGPGVLKILAVTLAAGIFVALYNIFR